MKNIEYIQIDPEVVEIPFAQRNGVSSTVMKIKNLTETAIYDLRFSIFNPDKFSFTPEVFHLQGFEEKIVLVELKPQQSKKPFKEFAYLKSPSPLINKRITLLVGKSNQNNSFVSNSNHSRLFEDQEPSQQFELQRRRAEDQSQDPQSLSNRAYHIAQAKAHEKMLMEKDSLIDKMEMEIQGKIAQCLKYQEQIRIKDKQIQHEKRRHGESRSETEQYKHQLLQYKSRLSSNEKSLLRIKEDERALKIQQQELRIQNEKVNILLKKQMQQKTRIYQLELNRYEMRISELESTMKLRFQQQLRIREDELRRARMELDSARKYQLDASRLDDQKQSLLLQVNGYLNQIQYYKEQMIRSRLQIQKKLGAEKQRSAITLQELKIENQVLIKKKIQLQNALQNSNKQLEMIKNKYQKTHSPIKDSYRDIREEEVMSLKEENVVLLERLNEAIHRECQECQAHKIKIEDLVEEMRAKEADYFRQKQKMKREEEENIKQLRKQLENLSETTVIKIKKLTADNKKLKKEMKNAAEEEERNKSKSKHEMQSTKLELLENQLFEMREELLLVKTKQKTEDRKTGIRNQSKEIQDSRSNKSQSMIRDQRVYEELGQLKEMEKIIRIEQKRLQEQSGIPARDGIFGIVDMFRVIREKLGTEREWWRQEESQYLNQIKGLKLRLVEMEGTREKQNYGANTTYSNEGNKRLYEFVQEQMRNQYKKLNDTIQLLQEKYEIFKRKMLSQFRAKLLDVLFKKDRKEILKLEPLLQKLLESVYNTSHKQALYSREVKRKLQLRKENKELRGKMSQLQAIIQQKKGPCTREPVKVIVKRDEQAFETVKLQATLLSCRAENERLKQQIEILKETTTSTTQEHRISLELLEKREDQISKLKSEIVQIDNLHRQQLTNAVNELDMMKTQFLKITQLEQKVATLSGKEKQNQELKEDLQRKNNMIKALREKEKNLGQVLEGTQRELQLQQHSIDKARSKEQARLQQMVGEFKEKNKHLKAQLEKKQDQIKQLKEDLQKKNAYIASQKVSSNNSTGRNQKQRQKLQNYSTQIQQLKQQNKKISDKNSQLKNSNTKLHNQIDNLKGKISEAQKQITSLTNDLKTQENQYLIKQKSLLSNIRGIIQMLRRLWRSIQFKVRKLSSEYRAKDTFDEMIKDSTNVDVVRLFNSYESMLNLIE